MKSKATLMLEMKERLDVAVKKPHVSKSFARRFTFERKEDITGTSGTGTVAEGLCSVVKLL
jgi:hypothetical protein